MVSRGQDEDNPAGEPPSEGPRGDDVEDSSGVGERIESIISAAERAAADIREDAEKRAQRYYEECKRRADETASQQAEEMADIIDSVVQRARRVAQQSDDLIKALEEARRRVIGGAPGLGSPQEQANNVQPEAAPPPFAQQRSPVPEALNGAGGPGPAPEGARLLATQMATTGSSRAEIARRLRGEFGVLDPTAILNDIWAA